MLGNIAFIIISLYSSAMRPDKVRGSNSVFVTFCKRSLDRIILPGEGDPGLSRFRGGLGDGSRLRFSGDDEAEAVGTDEGSVEVVDAGDMFELGISDDGPDGVNRIGIA